MVRAIIFFGLWLAFLTGCTSPEPVAEGAPADNEAAGLVVTATAVAPTPHIEETAVAPPPPPTTKTITPETTPTTAVAFTPTPTPTLEIRVYPLRTHQTLWFAHGDAVWRSDVHGVEVDRLTGDGFMDPEDPGFETFVLPGLQLSPDGRWLVNRHHKRGLILVDLATRQERLLRVWARAVAWSPDSRFLAYAPGDGAPGRPPDCAVCLYDLAQDDHINLVPRASTEGDGVNQVWTMTWSPNGDRLAYGCCFTPREPYDGVSDGRLEIITIASGLREAVGPIGASVGGGVEYICWTAPGEVITSWGNWELCSDPAQTAPTLSVDNLLADWSALYDEENRWTATRLHVTDQTTGQLVWEQVFAGWTTLQLAWSPDGRYLFFDDGSPHSPIWRATADGLTVNEVLPEGYLLGVVDQWE